MAKGQGDERRIIPLHWRDALFRWGGWGGEAEVSFTRFFSQHVYFMLWGTGVCLNTTLVFMIMLRHESTLAETKTTPSNVGGSGSSQASDVDNLPSGSEIAVPSLPIPGSGVVPDLIHEGGSGATPSTAVPSAAGTLPAVPALGSVNPPLVVIKKEDQDYKDAILARGLKDKTQGQDLRARLKGHADPSCMDLCSPEGSPEKKVKVEFVDKLG
eukprot:gene10013-7899_t